jgi:hypothetical protein
VGALAASECDKGKGLGAGGYALVNLFSLFSGSYFSREPFKT